MAEPQFGDLDAMVQSGTVFEMSRLFEKYARDKLGKAARTLKVTIIPVRRDRSRHEKREPAI